MYWDRTAKQFLADHCDDMSTAELAAHFGVKAERIRYHLKAMGIKRGFTEEEKGFVIRNMHTMPVELIARRLNCSAWRARQIMHVVTIRPWTMQDEIYLRANYRFMTETYLAQCMDRSTPYVRQMARNLQLSRGFEWDWEKDIELLRMVLWGTEMVDEMAEKLGVPVEFVRHRIDEKGW